MSSSDDSSDCRRSLTLLQCNRTLTPARQTRMRIRTPADLGAAIRDRRTKLGLGQGALARKVGVSRQWIVEAEKGKPRAEIGLLLRTIQALGIALVIETAVPGKKGRASAAIDID